MGVSSQHYCAVFKFNHIENSVCEQVVYSCQPDYTVREIIISLAGTGF